MNRLSECTLNILPPIQSMLKGFIPDTKFLGPRGQALCTTIKTDHSIER